jgi:hypothetical protein
MITHVQGGFDTRSYGQRALEVYESLLRLPVEPGKVEEPEIFSCLGRGEGRIR